MTGVLFYFTMVKSRLYSLNFFTLTGTLLVSSVYYWINFFDDIQRITDKAQAATKPEYLTGETEVFDFVIGNNFPLLQIPTCVYL